MAEDGTPVDPVEPTAPANPTAPEGGEGNPTEPAQEPTAQATDATEPTADMPSLLGEGDQNDGDQEPAKAAPRRMNRSTSRGSSSQKLSSRALPLRRRSSGSRRRMPRRCLPPMVPTARQYLVDDLKAKSQEWASLSEKDPEIGGANFKANVGVANQALKQFATPEFTALLRGSGLGAHPEVVRVFYRIGKAMQQDHGVTGSASAPAGARRRYPKSNMVVDV